MRNETLEFFAAMPGQAYDKYNKALDLYRKSAGHNTRQVQFYNNNPYSSTRLDNLLYELKKLHNITEKEIKLYKPAGEAVEAAPEPEAAPAGDQTTMIVFGAGATGTTSIFSRDDVFAKAPDEVKTDIKLRDEFPFLRSADCPDEFKVLVADKITFYESYVESHRALLVGVAQEDEQEPVKLSDEEIFALAKTAVESFEMNQAIYDELVCYKNTGKILGKHPIFKAKLLRDKVAGMSNQDLIERQSNLVNYINRNKSNLKEAVNEKAVANLTQKLEEFLKEKELVDAQIEANDKK